MLLKKTVYLAEISNMLQYLRKNFSFLIYLCIAAAVVGRFWLLGASFENDEIFSAITSDPLHTWGYLWHRYLMIDVHPPLSNFILYLWNHLIPYGNEIWMRLPSLFFALLALFLTWKLFPIRLGKKARLLLTGCLACHTFSIGYAQSLRAYALMLCLSVPLTFLFLDMAQFVRKNKKISSQKWTAFWALSLLLCWSHYFGALVFGAFSTVLFCLAVYYKRPLWTFILVPFSVFVLFLPWLVPNFLINLGFDRFEGNWWASGSLWRYVPRSIIFFLFSSFFSYKLFLWLGIVGVGNSYLIYRKKGAFPYLYDISLLLAVILIVALASVLLSLQLYVMIGRYFTGILPAFFLVIILITKPLIKKHILFVFPFILYFLISLSVFFFNTRIVANVGYLTARTMAQVYKDRYVGKDLFLVSISGYPNVSKVPLYSFYLNRVWNMNVPVKELYQMPEKERNELLAQRENAVIWMTDCEEQHLKKLKKEWNRSALVEFKIANTCFIELSEEGEIYELEFVD